MKVVLLENVKKLGNKNEIKEVNNGYAKNFLFPQKLAAIATSQMIKQAEANAQKQEELKAKAVLEAEKTAREIKDKRFIIKMKTGDEGQLFEAVSIKKISENGFTIDEKQIEIGEPIKKIGEFKVKINFNKNLTSFINVVVQEEK
jgi:large subunit ribosomal protein L9